MYVNIIIKYLKLSSLSIFLVETNKHLALKQNNIQPNYFVF